MDILLSAASIDITPATPVPLFGFSERHGVYSAVHDGLEMNLAAIKQGDNMALIYSIDTLFVPEDWVELVVATYGKEYGITEKDVWMAATHTHFAPSLDKEKDGLGKLDDAYYMQVKEKILLLTQKVLSGEYKNVQLQYGHNTSKLNVNRRKKLIRPKGKFGLSYKVLMYPDYSGTKDSNIHTLRLIHADGSTAMVLWNYACHPVGYTHRSKVSSEYIGIIRQELRGHYHNDKLPVVFLLGFAGNLKPDVTAVTQTRWKDMLNYIFQLGPKYTRFPTTAHYLQWNEMLWQEVKTAIDTATHCEELQIKTSTYQLQLKELIGNSSHNIFFKKLQLTKRLQLTGVSAEVLAEYSAMVNEVAKPSISINVGCLAGTRIYLPADVNVHEGGYEVYGFKHRFGISGLFKKGLDNIIKMVISKL